MTATVKIDNPKSNPPVFARWVPDDPKLARTTYIIGPGSTLTLNPYKGFRIEVEECSLNVVVVNNENS